MENVQRKTEQQHNASAFHSDGGLSGIIGLVGQPGCGKTYRLGRLIANCRRVVVYNSVASYLPHQAERKNRLAGFQWAYSMAELVRLMQAGKQRGGFRIVYTPIEGDEQNDFANVSKLVWAIENCVFAVDEIWMYKFTPGHHVKRMMLTGRHHGITLLWTAQRPAEVNATLRSVSTQLYLGRMTTRLDLEHFRGSVADEALSKLPSLPARTFIYRDEVMNWRLFK